MDERGKRQMRRRLYDAIQKSDAQLFKEILTQCEDDGLVMNLDDCSVTETRRYHSSDNSDGSEYLELQSLTYIQMSITSLEPIKLITELLNAGASIDAQNETGHTALSLACSKSLASLVKWMISKTKADVNIPDNKGITPLMVACMNGDTEIVKLLLTVSSINIDYTDSRGNSSLHYILLTNREIHGTVISPSRRAVIVDMLARRGCDVNQSNKEKLTPVMISARDGNNDAIQTLLLAGCELSYTDTDRCTALLLSVKNGLTSTVRLLLQNGADPSITDSKKVSPLLYAVRRQYKPIIDLILSNSLGAQTVNIPDYEGTTPILQAVKSAWQGKTAILTISGDIIKALLDRGCDVNIAQYSMGWTPLYAASLMSNQAISSLLIEHGADVNLRDKSGETVLHAALNVGNPSMIQLLIESGCDVNIQNISGVTALYKAISHRCSLSVVESLLEAGSNINMTERLEKKTPLHAAVQAQYTEAALLLIEQGCDINSTDITGTSPLTRSIEKGLSTVTDCLLSNPECDVNLGTQSIALHAAVNRTEEHLINRLVKLGADINKTNSVGMRPIQIAVEAYQLRIIRSLITIGCTLDCTETDRDLVVPKSCCHTYHDTHPHTELQPLFAAVKFDSMDLFKLLLSYYHRKPYPLLQTLHDMLTIAIDTGSRATQMLSSQGRKLLLDLLRNELSSPSSLLDICRGEIRRCLGTHIITKVDTLHIPTPLKHFIVFDTERHLDLSDLDQLSDDVID